MNPHGRHHSAEADSSADSTPRAPSGSCGHHPHHLPPPPPIRWHPDDPAAPLVRLMCSYGGRILPRPHDNQLRYVGGETRIVALPRSASFAALVSRLSNLLPPGGSQSPCLKYQLPNEDLDALVSLTSDEDVENMFDEYDRLAPAGGRTARLRLFLFPPPSAAFGSIVDVPGSARDRWFVDALNGRGSGPPSLDRGHSEASSLISEVPDYLFGLEANSDEQPTAKPRAQPVSEPGSPFSASSQRSVPAIPDLPPVRNQPEVEVDQSDPADAVGQQQQAGLVADPPWSYAPDPNLAPVYYVPAPVHGGSQPVQVQQAPVPVPVHHVLSMGPMTGGQVPPWFQQPFPAMAAVQGGPVYMSNPTIGHNYPVGVGAETYEAPAGMIVPVYRSVGVPSAGGEDVAVTGSEMNAGKPTHLTWFSSK